MISDDDSTDGGRSNPGDRRKRNIPVAIDRRKANAAEKRRSSERRRLIDPTTCERDYTDEETAFMKAMERFKRKIAGPFQPGRKSCKSSTWWAIERHRPKPIYPASNVHR